MSGGKATNKFCFRGIWYPANLVRQAACRACNLKEADCQSDSDLSDLVDAIVKGSPTRCAEFIVALNEGGTK